MRKVMVCLLALMLAGMWALAEGAMCVSTPELTALLSLSGQEIIAPGIYDEIFTLTEGRYAVRSGGKYGMCGGNGALLTEIKFEMLAGCENGILFRQDGLMGMMDLDGIVRIPAIYTQLACADDGGFYAITSDLYDDASDEIFYIPAGDEPQTTGLRTVGGLREVSEGRMVYLSPDTELYGYLDGLGGLAMPARLAHAGAYRDGLARASDEGLFGIIDMDGEWRIPPEYAYLERGDGLFVGLTEGAAVVWDASCAERFRVEGEALKAAVVGAYPIVVEAGVMTLYNLNGTPLLQTDANATLVEGVDGQLILSDGPWGSDCASVVYPDGTRGERRDQHLLPLDSDRYIFVTMPVATYYSDVLGELRYSSDHDGMRFGIMNAAGEEILPAESLDIYRVAEGCYLTIAEDGLRVVDRDGNVLWNKIEDEED